MEKIDIFTGTLGKAMGGALGGFTTAKKEVIELLRQRSRPYLFSNSLPPHVVAAGIKAFEMLSAAGDLREQLAANTALLPRTDDGGRLRHQARRASDQPGHALRRASGAEVRRSACSRKASTRSVSSSRSYPRVRRASARRYPRRTRANIWTARLRHSRDWARAGRAQGLTRTPLPAGRLKPQTPRGSCHLFSHCVLRSLEFTSNPLRRFFFLRLGRRAGGDAITVLLIHASKSSAVICLPFWVMWKRLLWPRPSLTGFGAAGWRLPVPSALRAALP